ncbi:hypothetical protein [uncultured Jannaschia sp.]|uniref:hypothetical protein n=1 Tax=uncultured Jannaschia sp. TaxID=293347 RepID=UPI00260C1F82|nr:hypothetical protein [uncultured Jannaschia sp.]
MDYEYPGWFGKHPYFPKTSRSGDTDVKLLHERVGALTTLWQSLEDQILQLASDILFTNIKLKTADVEFVLELLIGRVSGFSEKLRLIRDVNNLVFKNGSSTYSRIKGAAKRCQYAAELRNAIVHATAGVTKYQDGYEHACLRTPHYSTKWLKHHRLGELGIPDLASDNIQEIYMVIFHVSHEFTCLLREVSSFPLEDKIANWWEEDTAGRSIWVRVN